MLISSKASAPWLLFPSFRLDVLQAAAHTNWRIKSFFESLSVNRRTNMCVYIRLWVWACWKVISCYTKCSALGTQCPRTEQHVLLDWVCAARTSHTDAENKCTHMSAYPDQAGNDAPLETSSCHLGSGSCRPGTDTHLSPSCRRGLPQLFPHHPRWKPWWSVQDTHTEWQLQMRTLLNMTSRRCSRWD